MQRVDERRRQPQRRDRQRSKHLFELLLTEHGLNVRLHETVRRRPRRPNRRRECHTHLKAQIPKICRQRIDQVLLATEQVLAARNVQQQTFRRVGFFDTEQRRILIAGPRQFTQRGDIGGGIMRLDVSRRRTASGQQGFGFRQWHVSRDPFGANLAARPGHHARLAIPGVGEQDNRPASEFRPLMPQALQ